MEVENFRLLPFPDKGGIVILCSDVSGQSIGPNFML